MGNQLLDGAEVEKSRTEDDDAICRSHLTARFFAFNFSSSFAFESRGESGDLGLERPRSPSPNRFSCFSSLALCIAIADAPDVLLIVVISVFCFVFFYSGTNFQEIPLILIIPTTISTTITTLIFLLLSAGWTL